MSFLASRLAGKEGAYFFQESKLAVTRLAQKTELAKPTKTPPPSYDLPHESDADVLPEVLRHSLPSKLYSYRPLDPSSLSTASKWSLPSDPNRVPVVSPDALNPLRAYVSLPQVTFGPRRWQFPDAQNRISASTANDLRRDGHHPPINPEKLKAAAEGLANVGKAFAVATAVVFGGGSLMFGVVISKLDLQNGDNVGVKVRDMVQPSFETIKEQVGPLRSWVENASKKWHLESSVEIKEKPMVKELSKILGVKARD